MTHRDKVSTWTVLVVDDEPDSIELVEDMLTFHGATVHGALDGKAALRMLETLRPTFIIADLSMPVMDGWFLLKNIRRTPELVEIPVLALTAHAMEGDKELVLAAGFDGYLSKPVNINTFIDDILELLPMLAD